jgi:2-polyprenyl-3-methyl-5-hydroxy-6-metoxy-1,4-benzoquinol methylase
LDKEILENFKQYLERKALYKSFGYDVDQERGFVLEQAKPLKGKILEAGTGKGHFALALAKAGYSFVTFDISAQEQHFARLNIAHFGLEKQVDFRIENGEHTSFISGSFDVIFSVNVLHHLRNPYMVLDEFIRILSSRGKIVFADFTEKGFRMMKKIHASQGNTHEVGSVALEDVKKYFLEKHFIVHEAQTDYQRVFVVSQESV